MKTFTKKKSIILIAMALSVGFSTTAFSKSYSGSKASAYAKRNVVDVTDHSVGNCGTYFYLTQDNIAYVTSDFLGLQVCPKAWNKNYNAYLRRLYRGVSGTDCTNFVSQALEAGGVEYDPMHDDSIGGSDGNIDVWFHKRNTSYGNVSDSISWIGVTSMRKRFTDGYFKSYKVSEGAARIGDIMIWKPKDGNEFNHTSIVTRVSGNNIYFSGHQTDRKDQLLTASFKRSYSVIEFWRPQGTPRLKNLSLNTDKSSSLSSSDNISENRPGRYAEFFKFHLNSKSIVTIDMKSYSGLDTFMFLSKLGVNLAWNDDHNGTNSQIVKELPAGTYYVEATSYSKGERGSFTISVNTQSSSAPDNDVIYPRQTVSGYLNSQSGTSAYRVRSGRRTYAKTFDLVLQRRTKVKIVLDMSRSMDAYMYLSQGGVIRLKDDDHGGSRDSQIITTLPAGTWQIEATTYNSRKTGSFNLSVEEL